MRLALSDTGSEGRAASIRALQESAFFRAFPLTIFAYMLTFIA